MKKTNDYDWLGVHGANVSNELEGYCEKEANALRDKILSAANTEELYEIKGTKYYISAHGNDENDGLSPLTPFASFDMLKNISLKEGDAVLLERNSIFRISDTIETEVNGLTFGTYGKGEKPRIYACPCDYADAGLWEKTDKPNVWRTVFKTAKGRKLGACGMFFNHGKEIGALRFKGIDDLHTNLDFYSIKVPNENTGEVLLYFDKGNPGEYYKSIEILPERLHIFFLKGSKDYVIDNLCLKYTGGFPILVSGKNVTITNCEIGCCGGLFQPNTRFGNGIEMSGKVIDVVVKNNWFYQVFDSALTWQGGTTAEAQYINIDFSENLFEYNNADVEFFAHGEAVVDNIRISKNIMRFTCAGWGTDSRTGVSQSGNWIRWIEGCISATTYKLNDFGRIEVSDNIMDCPAGWIIRWTMPPKHIHKHIAFGNKVYVKKSYRITDVGVVGFSREGEIRAVMPSCATEEEMLAVIRERFDKTVELHWYDE